MIRHDGHRARTTGKSRIGGLEVRSIDYVPLDERHGKIWHLGPLWFMSNAQIATLAVGLISITEGGVAVLVGRSSIVVGTLVGTLFMAFHSAQGPQLGLPQMIQSRPQFGYLGALLVWLFAYVQYAGFNVFNTVLAGQSMHSTAHGPTKLWVVIVTVVAFVIALVGYDMIHKAEQFLTYAMIVIFGLFTIGAVLPALPGRHLRRRHVQGDAVPRPVRRRRRLPDQLGDLRLATTPATCTPDVTVRKTFYWTYWGSAIGGGWMMIVGSVLVAWVGRQELRRLRHRRDRQGRQRGVHRLRRDRADPRRRSAWCR